MSEALIQLTVFLLQTIMIVAAILIIVAGLVAIATKGKMKEKANIKIKKLNKYYEELLEKMQEVILTKSEKKALAKAKKLEKKKSKKSTDEKLKHIYFLKFNGDIRATGVNQLREEISAILTIAKPSDEVLLQLESAGGVVHGYGLAASELQRIKNKNIPLTIAVDKVAASGGYMMASVADKIIAAPFAIIGSIGVIAQLPNFHRLLKKHDIDFEQITAGEYKRTLSVFGENTKKGREKMQDEVEETHELFKEFISMHRPQVDLSKIATGEHWFAKKALELKLIDELMTSDDYLMNAMKEAAIYQVTYQKKKKFVEKLADSTQTLLHGVF